MAQKSNALLKGEAASESREVRSALAETSTANGYLMKLSQGNKWQKRFFIIKGPYLMYWASEGKSAKRSAYGRTQDCTIPETAIDLRCMAWCKLEDQRSVLCLTFTGGRQTRLRSMSHADKSQMPTWLHACTAAMQGAVTIAPSTNAGAAAAAADGGESKDSDNRKVAPGGGSPPQRTQETTPADKISANRSAPETSIWCCLFGVRPDRALMNRQDSMPPPPSWQIPPTPAQERLNSEEVDRFFRKGEDCKVLAGKPGGDEGLYQEAIVHYRKAIMIGGEGNRAVAPALSQCAHCLQEIGQRLEALDCYEKLVVLCPADQDAWYSKGFVEDEIGASKLEKSGSDQLLNSRAAKYFNSAVRSFGKALAIHPGDKECLVMLGNVHMQLNNFEQSLEYYHQSLVIEPECTMTYYNIAHVHHSMALDHETTEPKFLSNLEKSQENFKEAIRLNPDYVDAYFNIGICYQDMAKTYTTQQNRTKRSECLRLALTAYSTVVAKDDEDDYTKEETMKAMKEIKLDLGIDS